MGRALLSLLLAAGGALAQETQTLETEDGVFALDVPAAWRIRPVPVKSAVLAYELEAPGTSVERWRDHALGYVIFFRKGPSKYRKVYENFLRHLRESGDPKDARRQLFAFHPDELRDEAERYLASRLKPVAR